MTTIPMGTTMAADRPLEIDAVEPAERGTSLFTDVCIELIVTFGVGLVGLAFGRVLGIDVVTTGIMFAIVAAVVVFSYNRVFLLGRQGRTIGSSQRDVVVLDRVAFEPIGLTRALMREIVALPIRALVAAAMLAPIVVATAIVVRVIGGIPMVVCVVVAAVILATAAWRVVDSPGGRRMLSAVSFHDRVARSRSVHVSSTQGLPTVGSERVHGMLADLALRTWLPVSLFVLYWLGTLGWPWPNPDRVWLPPAYEVWQSLTEFWWFERFTSDIVPSLWTIALGLSVTIVLGIGLGVLVGTSRRLTEILRPLLDFVRSIPKILLITPIVALAGSGAATSVIVIISGAVWPLLLGTLDGIAGVHPAVHDMGKTYRISRRDQYTQMIIPAAAPNIFAGLRTSVSIGVILLVIVQSIGEARGLGFHLRAENEAFKYDNMWAAAAMLGALGYLLNVIVSQVEKRVLHWFYAKGTDV